MQFKSSFENAFLLKKRLIVISFDALEILSL